MKRFALAFLTTAVSASAGAVAAQDHRIPYQDLDLATVEGAAAFDSRVRAAAYHACSGGLPVSDARCRLSFREQAMRQLPEVQRQDYARARGGRLVTRTAAVSG